MCTVYFKAGEIPNPGLRERSKQRSCLLEVCRVKPFGEPPVDGCQEVMGFLAFAVLLPESSQAGGRSSRKGRDVLRSGHVKSVMETGFSFAGIDGVLVEEECAFEAMQL